MSISAFRELVEKPGCRWFIAVVSLGFAVGMMGLTRGCSNPEGQADENRDTGPTIATVGDFKVFANDVKNDPAQKQSDPLTSTPAMIARNSGQALDNQVTRGLLLLLAKQLNVPFDDKSLMTSVGTQFDDSLEMQKMQLGFQKKIPMNATDQQLSDYLKKTSGQTLAEQKKSLLDAVQAQLNDPAEKPQILARLSNELVEKAIEASLNPSDDDLKHSQDVYNTKRIYFDSKKHPNEDVQKVAEGVLADLSSKKITFEQAMDKYTDDQVPKGKPAHENTNEVQKMTALSDENYKPVMALQPGQLTAVLPAPPTGYAIYRLDNIKANIPPDFDKNKASIKKNYLQTLAATKLQADLKALRATNVVKWSAPGWDVLYAWYQATVADNSFGTKSTADQNKIQMDFFEKGSSSDAPQGKLAAAGAIDPIWAVATEKEKKELEPKYIDVLSSVLESAGSYAGDMLLAKLAAGEKKNDLVFQGLIQAAQVNLSNGVTSEAGPENFSDITEMIDKYNSMKLLNADQMKQLQDAQDEFRSEMKEYEQSLRDNAKQAAAAAEESKKEAAAAAAKAKADALKAPVKLTPGGGPIAPHTGAPTVTPGPAANAPAKVGGTGQLKKITIQQPPPKR